ncbi:DUF4232 domain-containing protein [Kitasatospora sp. NPDC006697]|uniref:DUF4232 domain-containing protein n=1 Tax=Kitasatospora sp. NPDC006697 TaxID=3364020 RepID=UPI0036BACC42
MSPKLAAAAVLLVGGLTLTACSSSGSSSVGKPAAPAAGSSLPGPGGTGQEQLPPTAAADPAPASPASPGPESAHPSAAPSAAAPSAAAPSAAAPGSAAPAGTPSTACTATQLTVVQGDPSVGAGQYDSTLTFTNTSSHTCTLTGYPGVSYVPDTGGQPGNPATRSGVAYQPVTLPPGGTAHAAFHDANGVSGYDPGQCQLTAATGLKIYPPDQKTALFLPWKTEHCAGAGIHSARIGPITG